MEPYTLLVIARAQTLAKRLRGALPPEQYLFRWVPNAAQALFLDLRPSLLILDLPPSGGARSVIRLKRQFDAPLLAISRTGNPVPDEVDASLVSPYRETQLAELVERTLMAFSPRMIRAAGMCLDVETRRFQVNGVLYHLPPIGCRILALLLTRVGLVVPRDELFRRVWKTDDGDSTRALDVHIAHLRRHIEQDTRRPRLILTERGVGYRLQAPD
jgi:DNA-binding response OmpR family regulator